MKRKVSNFFVALFLTIFLNNRLQPVQIDLKTYKQIDSPLLQFLYHLVDDLLIQLNTITAINGLVLISIFLLLTYREKISNVLIGTSEPGYCIKVFFQPNSGEKRYILFLFIS